MVAPKAFPPANTAARGILHYHFPMRIFALLLPCLLFAQPPARVQTGYDSIRPSMLKLPGYQEYLKRWPGIGPMAANLVNAKEAMPTLPQWPRVVNSLGNGIASVLLGRAAPAAALNQAAQQADTILNVPGAAGG